MHVVDNDSFLKQLASLLETTQGTVWLTHKRLLHDGDDASMKHEDSGLAEDTREYPCLVRVKDGEKTKISTKVVSSDLAKFYTTYGALLKSSMSTLRKRDKKREKLRSEQAARRKKMMTEPVVINGPKRGAGRRRRQRQIRAALKQQQSQRKFKEREEAKQKTGG